MGAAPSFWATGLPSLNRISSGIDCTPNWLAMPVFLVGMLALGMGNGSVFQLVPQRFRREIGVMTGLVGMSGGIGGFYLASSLGYAKQLTGSYGPGFLVFAMLAAVALVSITGVRRPIASALTGALRGIPSAS